MAAGPARPAESLKKNWGNTGIRELRTNQTLDRCAGRIGRPATVAAFRPRDACEIEPRNPLVIGAAAMAGVLASRFTKRRLGHLDSTSVRPIGTAEAIGRATPVPASTPDIEAGTTGGPLPFLPSVMPVSVLRMACGQ